MDLQYTTCRVCLEPSGAVSLFHQSDDGPLSAKLMRWTSLVITEGDGLPPLLCAACAALLQTAHEFFHRCELSDQALRSAQEETLKLEIKEEIELTDHELKFEDLPSTPPPLGSPVYPSEHKQVFEPKELVKVKRKHHRAKRKSKGKAGPIQCTVCGILANCQSALKIHLRVHTGEKPFQCTQCAHQYKSSGALKRHIETRHLPRERRFTCETCGVSFYRKNEIIQHIRRHTGERPHVCPFCQQRFLQVSSLIRHKRIHTGDKPYPCQLCNKAFPDRGTLSKHLTVHSDQRNHHCHLCAKAFKSKNSLNIHIQTIHSNAKSVNEATVCNFCGATFSVKGNLTVHIQRRHSEKSGQCPVCRKPFSDLQVHMRKHTGEKPYICDLCNKAFARKSCLANHWLFKHRNAERFKCSLGCPRSFPTVAMLKFHCMKQHTQQTPHVCPQCARGFFRPCDLTRHLRVTHNMCIQPKKPKGDVVTS